MNRNDLSILIAEKFGFSKKDAYDVVESIFSAMAEKLSTPGGRVEVRYFGTFTAYESKPRNGRNPKTGEVVPIPARRRIRFKMSAKM